MSRALDHDTASALGSGVPEEIYLDISAAVCPDPPSLLEIEILGKSHSLPTGTYLLSDGNCIGVQKSKLVQAFIHARQFFFDHLRPYPLSNKDDLLKATAVILLFDPEHLTAANSRKLLIQAYKQGSRQDLERILKAELLFVDSYLTSRLHRHTKSPTLWSHRRWLLEEFKKSGLEWDVENGVKDVILVAAERHPRNYYAWLHLRWLVQQADNAKYDGLRVLSIVKGWCLRHPSDTSGFSFLLFYLDSLTLASASPDNTLKIYSKANAYKEVLELAKSFKWTHESVWVFLRTLAGSAPVEDPRTGFLEAIKFIESQSTDPKAISILQASAEWYLKCGQTSRKLQE